MRWLFVFLALTAAIYALTQNQGTGPNTRAAASTAEDPIELARALIANDKANVAGSSFKGKTTLTFEIVPWALTISTARSAYYSKLKQVVPEVFARFPDVEKIRFEGLAEFKDIRGNMSLGTAIWAEFSRANAASVNWQQVESDNLLKIADASWAHPGFSK